MQHMGMHADAEKTPTPQEQIWQDGEFHLDHLPSLLEGIPSALSVDWENGGGTSFVATVSQAHNCVVLVRKNTEQSVKPPFEASFDDKEGKLWELRFLGCTREAGHNESNHKWSGKQFVRHGGYFPGWWQKERTTHREGRDEDY